MVMEVLLACSDFGDVSFDRVETVSIKARGDETHAQLKAQTKRSVPFGFKFTGGRDRIRKGDSVMGDRERTHERDQQAIVTFTRKFSFPLK